MGEVYKEKRIEEGGLRLFIKCQDTTLCGGTSRQNVNFNQLQSDKQLEIPHCVLWHIQAQLTLVLLQYTWAAVAVVGRGSLFLHPGPMKRKGKAETQLMPGTEVTWQGVKQLAGWLTRTVRGNHRLLESINPNVN